MQKNSCNYLETKVSAIQSLSLLNLFIFCNQISLHCPLEYWVEGDIQGGVRCWVSCQLSHWGTVGFEQVSSLVWATVSHLWNGLEDGGRLWLSQYFSNGGAQNGSGHLYRWILEITSLKENNNKMGNHFAILSPPECLSKRNARVGAHGSPTPTPTAL